MKAYTFFNEVNLLQIIEVAIDKLKEYENNPRNNEKAVGAVAESIKEFGFKVPVVIDKNYTIIAGHTRKKASELLGLETVPCIMADDLTPEKIKAYRLADNKTAELAEWDFEKLEQEMSELTAFDFDMSAFGFDEDLFDFENQAEEDEFDAEQALEEIEEPITQLGDIWQLGNHRLMCGDSLNCYDIEKLINGKTINLLFTSPPYNMNKKMYATYEDNLESREYIEFNIKVIERFKKHLKGFLFWNISYNKNARWEFIEILYKIVKETNLLFLELIVWNKKKAMPIRSSDMITRTYEDILLMGTEEEVENNIEMFVCSKNNKKSIFNKKTKNKITNYWEFTSNNTQLNNHKACFPVELPKKAIKLTTVRGEIVCDCFGGSGSTLIACEQLNRQCFMMELDPKYCDVIIKRWETLTGKKAIKTN